MKTIPDWSEKFVGTRGLSIETRQLLLDHSKLVHFKKDDVIFSANVENSSLLFLLSGQVRVQQVSQSGREIVLYRAVAGENCVMTTAGLLSDGESGTDGIAETDVSAASISQSNFDSLMAQSSEFRQFVLKAYNKRIRDLFEVVDEVAFGRIDIRLAGRILRLAEGQSEVKFTHQDLAKELGTAREVISRQLTEFQRRGFIEQARGKIIIENSAGLSDLAQSE